MGLMDDQDQLGKELHEKRDLEKLKQDAANEAKEQAVKDMEQHKEDKEQGML